MLCILFEMRFESLIYGLDVCLSSLFVAFISMCFSLLEKPSFFKLNSFLTHPRQIPIELSTSSLDRILNSFSIH